MTTVLQYLVIAAVIGLLLFGVALLLFGRGERLSALPARTSPAQLPERGIDGADVRRVRFALALRGYRMSDVDWTLERLADELDRSRVELARLTGDDPDSIDPQATDPLTTDLHAADEPGPHVTDPAAVADAADPDAADPDAADPDTADPDAVDPDTADPDTADRVHVGRVHTDEDRTDRDPADQESRVQGDVSVAPPAGDDPTWPPATSTHLTRTTTPGSEA